MVSCFDEQQNHRSEKEAHEACVNTWWHLWAGSFGVTHAGCDDTRDGEIWEPPKGLWSFSGVQCPEQWMHLMMTGLLLPIVFVTSSFFHLTFYWASQAQAASPLAEALQGISALSPLSPLAGLSAAGQDPCIPGKPPCQEEHTGCAGPALAGAASKSHGQLRGAAFQRKSKTRRFFWE